MLQPNGQNDTENKEGALQKVLDLETNAIDFGSRCGKHGRRAAFTAWGAALQIFEPRD